MEKIKIGYIFGYQSLSEEEDLYLKVAQEKGVELVLINVADSITLSDIEERLKQCDIVFNNTAGALAQEIVKMAEFFGIKTSSESKVYFYTEDKWMFYLKCKKAGIPVPETMLLSGNFNAVKKQLTGFEHQPIILKRVVGEQGEFVKKAETKDEAIKIIRNFYERGLERLPIIAQQYFKSDSYRVTVIGDEIVQTALKIGYGWKATGIYAEKSQKFELDDELVSLTKKLVKICKIDVCGIDFLKHEGKWYALEINSEPSLDFFKEEKEMLVGKVLDLLIAKVKEK